MFNQELHKLWNDAIVAGDATILSIPVNLLYLLTIRESGKFRRWGIEEGELTLYTCHSYAPDYHDTSTALPLPLPCLLQHWQEGSLGLLARKILLICIATLPGSSSASPYLWTLLRNASSSSVHWSASLRPGLLGMGCQQAK